MGTNGAIVHGDGDDWKQAASPTTNNLRAVFGISEHDVWAVGDLGMIVHIER